jgi:hypothetical protein
MSRDDLIFAYWLSHNHFRTGQVRRLLPYLDTMIGTL